jgi:hypothetical protein
MIEHVLVARTAFSTKPSNGPRNSIKCARSSWNTSQIMLHSRLGAEQLVTQIADLILNPVVGPTYAAFGHGSAQPQPAASGLSPRRIAMMLNQEGIPGPSGRVWYAATIRGRPAYKDGLLRQPTYAGVLTWCRRSNAKDPAPGRLVRQINDPGELVTQPAPQLRIIDQDLWDRVQGRPATESVPDRHDVEKRDASGGFWEHRRPRYLLTGKVFCGCCGRPFAVVGKDYRAVQPH